MKARTVPARQPDYPNGQDGKRLAPEIKICRLDILRSENELDFCVVPLRTASLKLNHGLRNSPGSFPMFPAIRRASSLVSRLAAERRPGSSLK